MGAVRSTACKDSGHRTAPPLGHEVDGRCCAPRIGGALIIFTEGPRVRDKNLAAIIWIALSLAIIQLPCGSAWAYPGGPLRDVTDIAPYCAGCHSSVGIEQLRNLPAAQAQKRTVAGHIDAIKSGEGPYAKLSPEQLTQLVADVEKVDANSKISIDVPATVKPGEKFSATVKAQGGSGPVVGIALLDVDLRDQAREVQGEGFLVDSAPQVTGPDGKSQDQWLSRRYD